MRFLLLSTVASILAGACGGEIVPNDSPSPEAASAPPVVAPSDPAAPQPSAPSDRCAAPERVRLIDGVVSIRSETASATDEFPSLDCESRGTADTLVGPQRYYALAVRAGHTYRFALNTTFHAVMVGFEADVACSSDEIQRACRSNGARGFASGLVNPGSHSPGATVFAIPPPWVATRDVDLVLVVDSDGASGSYELTITEE